MTEEEEEEEEVTKKMCHMKLKICFNEGDV